MQSKWNYLTYSDTQSLKKAREQLHQAVQLVSLVPRSLLPEDKGDGFANLEWMGDKLASQIFESKYRTGLQFSDLSLHLLENEYTLAQLSLADRTFDQGFDWLKRQIRDINGDASKLSRDLPYQIPFYATAQGELFKLAEPDSYFELQHYFANTDLVLRKLEQRMENASTVRCWPHHFDIATLITLVPDADLEKAKTIGVGFSPGDENFDRPYFYVTPWPYPEVKRADMPTLPGGGFWHVEGWIGAILSQAEIIKTNTELQKKIVEDFFQASIDQLKSWID